MGDVFPSPAGGDTEILAALSSIESELIDVNTELDNILSEVTDIKDAVENMWQDNEALEVAGVANSDQTILANAYAKSMMLKMTDISGANSHLLKINGLTIASINTGTYPASDSVDKAGWLFLQDIKLDGNGLEFDEGIASSGTLEYLIVYRPDGAW